MLTTRQLAQFTWSVGWRLLILPLVAGWHLLLLLMYAPLSLTIKSLLLAAAGVVEAMRQAGDALAITMRELMELWVCGRVLPAAETKEPPQA